MLLWSLWVSFAFFFFFQAEDGIRDLYVTGVQTCALPISHVGPRSVCERRAIAPVGRGHARRLLACAGVLREPLLPCRPPGPLMKRSALQPFTRSERCCVILPGEEAVAALGMHRAAHDAGVVAATRQQEGVVGTAREP